MRDALEVPLSRCASARGKAAVPVVAAGALSPADRRGLPGAAAGSGGAGFPLGRAGSLHGADNGTERPGSAVPLDLLLLQGHLMSRRGINCSGVHGQRGPLQENIVS